MTKGKKNEFQQIPEGVQRQKKVIMYRAYRVKGSLEDAAVPLRKLQKQTKKGLAALQIRQRGKNISPSKNFYFQILFPLGVEGFKIG